ncbi:hypothetical protein LGQ02_05885 [Bacillus shivajii]|uniref:hypothetical protein n=1 Tax=Bacillus shivajii TaxID=1983719 RepID=UPI001CF96F25|nr:hypothetical protein [Bacillus shivajii]UCZ54292.1 hypothetical protein LGQ02_05885 [Bacillus shivajii]
MDKKESNYEGRDEVMMDIDRMTNEGLAGGQDHVTFGKRQIEQAQEFYKEDAPYVAQKNQKEE